MAIASGVVRWSHRSVRIRATCEVEHVGLKLLITLRAYGLQQEGVEFPLGTDHDALSLVATALGGLRVIVDQPLKAEHLRGDNHNYKVQEKLVFVKLYFQEFI